MLTRSKTTYPLDKYNIIFCVFKSYMEHSVKICNAFHETKKQNEQCIPWDKKKTEWAQEKEKIVTNPQKIYVFKLSNKL